MKDFILSDKVKNIFELIDQKARRANQAGQELTDKPAEQVFPLFGGITLLVEKNGNHPCPINGVWSCDVDDYQVCAKTHCEPWVKQFPRGLD